MPVTDIQSPRTKLALPPPKEEQVKEKNDFYILLLLLILYCIQTFPRGIYTTSIPIILLSKGVPIPKVSFLVLSYIPYCLKFLVAPIVNMYYSKTFGRGKTYLIPIQYIHAILTIGMSFYVTGFFESQNILAISIVAWLDMTLMMLHDIVLDGWIVRLVSAKNSHTAAVIQSTGTRFGMLFSWNALLSLGSTEFCNKYIFATPREEGLIKIDQFLFGSGIFIVFLTVAIHFLMQESKMTKEVKQIASFKEVVNTLTRFVQNPKLKPLFIIFCTWNITFGPIHALAGANLMKQGLSKEAWLNLNTPNIPLNIISAFLVGYFCKKYHEARVINAFYIMRLITTFYIYGVIRYFKYIPENLAYPSVLGAVIFTSISFNGVLVALLAYGSRVSKITYGAPLMSAFSATTYIARLLGDSFSYALVDYVGWNRLAIISMVATLFYACLFVFKIYKLESTNPKEFMSIKAKDE